MLLTASPAESRPRKLAARNERINGEEPMDGIPSREHGAETAREAAHLRIVHRLLDELGDKADDHCLTLTYYLVRAGGLADARMVLHFASRAARVALAHESYYVAGRYFQAAAEAGGETLSLDQRASLYCKAGEAFKRWSDAAVSSDCYREAAELYERSGNRSGCELALEAIRDNPPDDEIVPMCIVTTAGAIAARHS